MRKTYVLDANALLNLVTNGRGAQKVKQLLSEAARSHLVLLISMVNWGEVFYISWQHDGEESARSRMAGLARLPLELVPVDLPQVLQAGEIKARHKIPYVDCLAAALAMSRQAVLVTSDRDFEKLGRRVQILWLARS